MSRLFTPFKIRELEIRNRAWVSPMCQYSCKDGFANDWHLVHLGSRAVGGAGLVMVEATAVSPDGRITPADLGIWSDAHARALAPIAQFIRSQGAASAIQLAHAGRKASADLPWKGGKPLASGHPEAWTPVAPSAIPFRDGWPTPRELTTADVQDVVRSFVEAARRSRDAGFDVVEIHMAHGYLIHEFLSPLANRRTDGYGGPFENRSRLALEIARAVRETWPGNRPVFARISATDWVDGGWDIEQSIAFSKALKEVGVDLIDCSSGGVTADARIPVEPGYQVPFSEAIRKRAQILTGAVGLITEAKQAEQILTAEKADAIFLARALLRDPYWPLHAAQELGAGVQWPNQYLRAKP